MKKNNPYTAKELLQNESFLRWRLFPTSGDDEYWTNYLKENPHLKEEIDTAKRQVKDIKLNDYRLSDREISSIFEVIEKRISRKQKRKKTVLLATVSTVAAIALLVIVFSIFTRPLKEYVSEEIIADNNSTTENSKDIRMIFGDESISLGYDADFEYNEHGDIIVSSGNKEAITKNISEKTVTTNKLIVPKGKRSLLTLSDGTKIWVNSGSELEFPTLFQDTQREIKVTGEIYIEVEKDTERPFIVHTDRLSVRVLGTRFNVSAYEDDSSSSVVLVEGKVEVKTENEAVTLKPDQMASIQGTTIRTQAVNVYDYISWKDGLMQFSSEPLYNILTRLGRYYDKHIVCEERIRSMKCTGKLVLFDDFEDILETITHTIPVRYQITDNEILISEK